MTAPVFVDTNVLVYARDTRDEDKHQRAGEWMALLWRTRRGRLSVQVLNEYFVTVTRKLPEPLDRGQAQQEIRELAAWDPVPLDMDLIESAWSAASSWQLSHWDALIVAAAQRSGSGYLLTEDLQASQTFDGLRVISLFTSPPPVGQ